MNVTERFAEAERAEAALRDYLRPAFAIVETAYLEKLTQLAAETPWEADKITKLASALKIARNVQGQIEAWVLDGPAAAAQIDHAAQIAKIPTHKRSILGL